MVPERPPLDIASSVNRVFIHEESRRQTTSILWGITLLRLRDEIRQIYGTHLLNWEQHPIATGESSGICYSLSKENQT